MRVALGRGQPAVAEQVLDQPEVGAGVEHVGGEGVAERVGRHAAREPGGPAPGLDDPVDAPHREAPAPEVAEERAVGLPVRAQVGVQRLEGGVAHGDHPLLRPLATHPDRAPAPIDIRQIQTAELGHPGPRRVEHLEDRPVARLRRRRGGRRRALEQDRGLVDRQEGDEPLRQPRRGDLPRRVPREPTASGQEGQAAPDGRQLARDGGAGEAGLVQPRQVLAQEPRVHVRQLADVPRREEAPELPEVGPVASKRVGRRAPLDGLVPEKRLHRLGHSALTSVSCLYPQPSLAQYRRSFFPRA